jgi:hypothetical protein
MVYQAHAMVIRKISSSPVTVFLSKVENYLGSALLGVSGVDTEVVSVVAIDCKRFLTSVRIESISYSTSE